MLHTNKLSIKHIAFKKQLNVLYNVIHRYCVHIIVCIGLCSLLLYGVCIITETNTHTTDNIIQSTTQPCAMSPNQLDRHIWQYRTPLLTRLCEPTYNTITHTTDGLITNRYIHQLYKTAELNNELYVLTKQWYNMNRRHHYKLWTDTMIKQYIRTYWPCHADTLYRYNKPILRADLFRYMIVYDMGGTYADVDTQLIHPIDTWHNLSTPVKQLLSQYNTDINTPARCMIGYENDYILNELNELQSGWPLTRTPQLCQWTFSCTARHPLFAHIITHSLTVLASKTIDEIDSINVLDLTGPVMFTDAIREYLYLQYNFTDWFTTYNIAYPIQIGDIILMPVRSFGYVEYKFRDHIPYHTAVPQLVAHQFAGSWKD